MKNIDKYIFPVAILIGGVALLAIGGIHDNDNDIVLMVCGAILIIIGLIWRIVMYSEEDKKWYEKAAEEGDMIALYYLGTLYYKGDRYATSEGGNECNARAAYYWHKAAEQGYAPAQYRLGYCYEKGFGVGKDTAMAIKWYKKAAAQDHEPAKEALEILEPEPNE